MEEHPQNTETAPSIQDLITLFMDPDDAVAALAMEQLVKSPECEGFIAKNQDTSQILLRRRIHQLNGVLNHSQLEERIVKEVTEGRLDIWSFAVMIDAFYDSKSAPWTIRDQIRRNSSELGHPGKLTLQHLSESLIKNDYIVPPLPWDVASCFLVGDVVDSRHGAPIMLCIIAQRMARLRDLVLGIGLHSGRLCLIDANCNIADPLERWSYTAKVPKEQLHICTSKELIRMLLVQMLTASMIGWECFDTELFHNLIMRIENTQENILPYPFGDRYMPNGDGDPLE